MTTDTRPDEIDLTDRSVATAASPADQIEVGQLQTVARLVLRPIFKTMWRIRAEGLENVPASGGAIIAPNHTAAIDSFFVPVVLPRHIIFVGKAEYLDDWKTRKLFPALGMIPLDRSGGSASERALNTAARVLESGKLFGIYPEGTRSRTGRLHKGHTGVARLALRCDVPIVPVGIIGSSDVQPPGAKVPKPLRTVTLRFGEPLDVSRYRERADDRIILRQITDELMYEIRNLSGQEYDPTYATSRTEPSDQSRPGSEDSPEVARRSSAELLAGHPKAG